MVEVEGVVPGDGAVEPGLEVGGEAVLFLPTLVVLAHPRHTGIHALNRGYLHYSFSAHPCRSYTPVPHESTRSKQGTFTFYHHILTKNFLDPFINSNVFCVVIYVHVMRINPMFSFLFSVPLFPFFSLYRMFHRSLSSLSRCRIIAMLKDCRMSSSGVFFLYT